MTTFSKDHPAEAIFHIIFILLFVGLIVESIIKSNLLAIGKMAEGITCNFLKAGCLN